MITYCANMEGAGWLDVTRDILASARKQPTDSHSTKVKAFTSSNIMYCPNLCATVLYKLQRVCTEKPVVQLTAKSMTPLVYLSLYLLSLTDNHVTHSTAQDLITLYLARHFPAKHIPSQ